MMCNDNHLMRPKDASRVQLHDLKARRALLEIFYTLEGMDNFYERVMQHPQFYRQFNCGKSLITAFNCPMEARLMKTRFADLWTQYNYLFYVIDGRKIWHTARGPYDLQKDSCVFVRKGGFILEQLTEIGPAPLCHSQGQQVQRHVRA